MYTSRMKIREFRACVLAISFSLLLPSTALPQASSSTVRGTVFDTARAVVPKARVTLTNTATNVERTMESNDAGIYVFPGVIPGPYKITAELAGMQKFEGVLTVHLQQDAVVDPVLQVGQVATQVDVQDVTPLVRVDSPTLGHALERQRIQQLPINGRGYQALLATVPGIDSTGIIQAYGMRTNTSTTLFDGAPVNEIWEGWDFGRPPGLDAVEEVQVELNNSSAKFTRPATVIMSSRSGTNDFHGAAFETNRNSGYGVARRRQDNFTKAPFLNRNEFGVSAGGPVIIPKLYNGKNRTFFFVAWESSRSVSYTTNQYSVPTEEMRNGDFRELLDAQGRQYQLYDPFTTNPTTFERQRLSYRGVNNVMDPARISPVAKYLFKITPLPNQPGVNPLLGPNWVGSTLIPNKQNTTSIRIDHRISDKNLIYGRATFGTNDHWLGNTVLLPVDIGNFPKAAATSNRHWPNQTGAFTWVHTFSPNFTNELLLNGSRDYHRRGSGDFETDYSSALGLPNPFGAPNWPSVTGSTLPNGAWPFGSAAPFWLITNYGMLQDNATKIHGKHEFQFGFQIRQEFINKSSIPISGAFDAGTLATSAFDPSSTAANPIALPLTGHGLANLTMGILNYTAAFRREWFHFRRQEYSPYFQDNWKVTPRLSLFLGLRYEARTPIYDRDGTLFGFDFNKRAFVTGTESVDELIQRRITLPSIVSAVQGFGGNIITYKEAGMPRNLVYTNWKQFGPRLGFAYRAGDGNKQFVMRGGYRVSYYPQKLQDWVGAQSSSIPVGANFTYSVTNTALSPDGLPNYGLRSVPQYVAGVNTPSSIINTNDTRLLTRGFSGQFLDPHHQDGRVQDWNLTVEKQVGPSMVAKVSYIGNYGDRQQQWINYNDQTPEYIWFATQKTPLPPGPFASVARRSYDQTTYGDLNLFTTSGYGWYNGVQLELERRYSQGFGFQVFYVLGNTLLVNRDTDDTQSLDAVYGLNNYLPGAVPTDPQERNKFINYKRDPNTPKHQLRWNFIYEIPIGPGKKFAGTTRGAAGKILGGWQITGLGNVRSNFMLLPTGYYPSGNKLEVYGYKYPIQDCRSGNCFPGYLWWNGYIPANRINSVDANGKPNGIMGVPDGYKPAQMPLIPAGSTALPANAPAGTNVSQFWDTNTVWVPLNNGTIQRTVFNDNMNPFRNQYIPGPRQWFQDASVSKFTKLTEQVTLRFNIDFFNVFNNPNNPNAAQLTDSVLSVRNSGSGARVTQLGLRLIW